MPDRELTIKSWDSATLEVVDENGVRQLRFALKDVTVMVRGNAATIAGLVEGVREGPPKRGRPRKSG